MSAASVERPWQAARHSEALGAVAGLPLWVSLTLEDSLGACLRSGESLADAVTSIKAAAPHLRAVLVNCCAPAAVSAAMPLLKAAAPPGGRVIYALYGCVLAATTPAGCPFQAVQVTIRIFTHTNMGPHPIHIVVEEASAC
jgi:S-methylmethionine-dependent homocysteine/selenocysteine methylase